MTDPELQWNDNVGEGETPEAYITPAQIHANTELLTKLFPDVMQDPGVVSNPSMDDDPEVPRVPEVEEDNGDLATDGQPEPDQE